MKKFFFLPVILLSLFPLIGNEIDSLTYSTLVSSISRAQAPIVSEKYVVFTARGTARFAGIAFEHEQYKTTWPFKRLSRKDEKGEPQKDSQGKAIESILFYIAEIPPETSELRYRMVIDGLWTTDPLNSQTSYDYTNGMMVSTLSVDRYEVYKTVSKTNESVRFICISEPGKLIKLAGTFNNWDPFMYEMTEIKAGYYELYLPLPKGTWYYAFFSGSSQIPDSINHERVYTKDGRIASVIVVR